jgi:serine/threonine protein kinase
VTARTPATPPELRGYTYQRLLGSGGFADVFLYQQHMPRRQVAVKVLLSDVVTESVRDRFHAEANLMAQVSTHPSIVSIHHAEIADDGRPYLVMEYCPRGNLAVRYRQERLAVAEALRIGVRLSGAVETAHRTGILHRDIKPANVLTTEYGWPALTDFGISSAAGQASEAAGMSVPWSAPELFAEPPTSDVRADVWSLGATVYTLLARRSPFEQPGGRNGAADLISRIERSPLPAIGRDDVPASLEQVLARAMAKRPASRYGSALELGRALQQVEIELQLAPTTIDVLEAAAAPAEDDEAGDDGRTRIRSLVTIPPQTSPTGPTAPQGNAAAMASADRSITQRRAPVASVPRASALPEPLVADTVHRPASVPTEPEADAAPAGRGRTVLVAASAVVLLGLAGVGAVVAATGGGSDNLRPDDVASTSTAGAGDPPEDALVAAVPAPADLTGAPDAGGVRFSWTNPDEQPGDSYLWRRTDPGAESDVRPVSELQVTVPTAGPVCIEVLLRRANGRVSDQGAAGCVP